MQKGCIFEFSHEFDLCRDILTQLIDERCKDQLLNKLSGEVLTAFIESVLNNHLSNYYQERMDITSIIHDIMDMTFADGFKVNTLYGKDGSNIPEDIFEITKILETRLFEMFRNIDVAYALWRVRSLSSYMRIVEYLGDYRIMEWHERSGIPYQGETKDLRYEFSLSSLYTSLGNSLEPYCGKYAGHYLNKYLDVIVRNFIEEAIFLDGNKTTNDDRYRLQSLVNDEVIISDYPYTREKIEQGFPLMAPDEIRKVITDGLLVIEAELQAAVKAAADVNDVISWFISDRVLTILINRPLSKVDFGERLKVDIKASIDNGDWVPPRLRNLVNI